MTTRLRFCKGGNLVVFELEDIDQTTVHRVKKKKTTKIEASTAKGVDTAQGADTAKGADTGKAATAIQAWWRGTLVRRALLHAALRAWIIQSWWRLMLMRALDRKRRKALVTYVNRERAVVKLQSLVRMWRVHWRYCQVLSAIYVIRGHWQQHSCQTCALLRSHCVVTATHLQFHIEVISR